MDSRRAWILGLILLLAFVLRLAAVWAWGTPPHADALEYHTIAVNLLSGKGYSLGTGGAPTAMRPPAYPVMLAGIYAVFGEGYHNVLYVQALLNTLLVLALFWLARRLSGSADAGLLAAGLFAIHTSFEIVSRQYSENLLLILVLGFMVSVYMALQKPGIGGVVWAIAGGIFAGLMGLTKPEMALLGLGLLLLGLLRPGMRAYRRHLALIAAVSLLMVGVWQVRNLSIKDTSQDNLASFGLLPSYYPALDGSWWWPVTDMKAQERVYSQAKLYFYRHGHVQMARDIEKSVMAHPFLFMKLCASRVIILWAPPPVGSSALGRIDPALPGLALVLQYVFVLFALGTLFGYAARKPELLPMLGLALYMTLVYGLLSSFRRYGYVLVPELCLFAAWGAWDLLNGRRTRA